MGKIAVFQAAEQGSTPCGVTKAAVRQDRYQDGKARHSRSGIAQSAGPLAVNHVIWVRIPVPEPFMPRSCGEKEIMPDYGSGGGGSSPSGSASRSASSMGERAVHARETNRFDSFAEYGGCSSTRQSAGL